MSTPIGNARLLVNDEVDKNFYTKYINQIDFFLSERSKKLVKLYFKNHKKDARVTLWKNLLIDSISFLKINDKRETLYSSALETIKKKGRISSVNELFDDYETLRKYNCYGIEDLEEYIDDFVSFESVLYGADHKYRDHVDHVISVWAIGIILLYEYNLLENIELNDEAKKSGKIYSFQDYKDELFLSKGEIVAAWTLTALCHDLGYPIEKASKINEKLKLIISHFGQINMDDFNYNFSLFNNFLVEKFLNITSSKPCQEKDNKHTKIQSKYRDKLSKSLEDYRHGIFSSLLLFKTLTYFLETDYSYHKEPMTDEDLRQFYIRKEVLRSIAAHTSPKLYHLNIKNLAFLLFISDELNEWGRPNFEEFKSYGSRSTKVDVFLEKYELSKNKDELKISIHYKYKYDNEIQEDRIKRKYRVFYHLLRSAKDDKNRKFFFRWKMQFEKGENKIIYRFRFDSSKSSSDIIKVTKESLIGTTIETELFKIMDNDKLPVQDKK